MSRVFKRLRQLDSLIKAFIFHLEYLLINKKSILLTRNHKFYNVMLMTYFYCLLERKSLWCLFNCEKELKSTKKVDLRNSSFCMNINRVENYYQSHKIKLLLIEHPGKFKFIVHSTYFGSSPILIRKSTAKSQQTYDFI